MLAKSLRSTRPGRRAAAAQGTRMLTIRPPMLRMSRIHAMIQSEKLPNCSTLAAELEVSPKTVQRDIDFMRDQLRLPITYDDVAHGFRYTEPVEAFPPVRVTHGEIVSLLLAQKALEQYAHTPFHDALAGAFSKLTSAMDGGLTVSWQSLGEAISFRPQEVPQKQLLHFQELTTATMDCHEVEFDYFKLKAKQPARRRVQPYHISCIGHQWYLFGHDLVRDAVRTFNLVRISKLKVLKSRFKRPDTFKPEELLQGSFSAFESANPEKVEIHFTGTAARLMSEKQMHASQKSTRKADGTLVVKLQVGLTPDLEAWICSWGAEALVVRPAALRARIRESHAAAAKAYG